MIKRKWERHIDPNDKLSNFEFYLGTREMELPPDAIVSVTFLEHLSMWRGMLNGIVSLFVMMQMKKIPGLLCAEIMVVGPGCGYTLSVWQGRSMVAFRDKGQHSWAMRFFSWIFFGGKAHAYFLSWLAHGRIPTKAEVPNIVRQHGKFYDDGNLVRQASRPVW